MMKNNGLTPEIIQFESERMFAADDQSKVWRFLGRDISEDDDVNYEIQEAIDNADKDDLADLIYDVYFGDDDYLKFFKDLHIKECD